jgi:hypothetical protein
VKAAQAGGEAKLILAAKDFFCSRNIMIEGGRLDYEERCRDTIDDAITPEHAPRLRSAFEVLRRACRW